MKKILLSTFVIINFVIYALSTHQKSNTSYITVTQSAPAGTPNASILNTGTTKYKNGSYTGSVADAFYGNVQIKAIISGGKISDVQILQYPSDRSRSIAINSRAMPLLAQESIQAQSAQVDGVSGATASSQAFMESLNSALSQAL